MPNDWKRKKYERSQQKDKHTETANQPHNLNDNIERQGMKTMFSIQMLISSFHIRHDISQVTSNFWANQFWDPVRKKVKTTSYSLFPKVQWRAFFELDNRAHITYSSVKNVTLMNKRRSSSIKRTKRERGLKSIEIFLWSIKFIPCQIMQYVVYSEEWKTKGLKPVSHLYHVQKMHTSFCCSPCNLEDPKETYTAENRDP